ncbi:MAG: alpha/beta hydrolase [Proteobacteria bacterium]|nr:alpha/beta hydrolase [Pseudomonadota bacterium]
MSKKLTFAEGFEAARLQTRGAEINLVHGGAGKPLLLMHGYPQTHMMWHRVAPRLAEEYHVICPDLRGYGDSSKPESSADHAPYSKREMANDMVEVMKELGYQQFAATGHDRGARVLHRMILDHPERVQRACVMDIAPTHHMFKTTDQEFATGYYHWFFLIQPNGLPERLIGADPEYYLTEKMGRWSSPDSIFAPEAFDEYLRCFRKPETIHASCEDYRAAASIDLEHDASDLDRKIECPLLVLWGDKGLVHRKYEVLEVWRERANHVSGTALKCGHYLPEESPEQVLDELLPFLRS